MPRSARDEWSGLFPMRMCLEDGSPISRDNGRLAGSVGSLESVDKMYISRFRQSRTLGRRQRMFSAVRTARMKSFST
jgi:hypothetical protein